MKPFIPVAFLIAAAGALPAAENGPVSFLKSIELPHVEGRIDHLAFDGRTQRLFIAALGNDSVEVIDTNAGTHITSLAHFAEPQGIAIAPDARVVMVADRRDGQVSLLNADDLHRGPTLRPGRDADNVRYDADAARFYVGFGTGAIVALDAQDGTLMGQAAVPGHPESFQLERAGPHIFVNVPSAGVLAVIDRSTMKNVTTFPVTAARACFPMAFDEANHRLFIGCRQPARMVVIDSANGHVVTAMDTVQDTDDLFYDPMRKRIYLSGGEGFLDVIGEPTPGGFKRIERLLTAPGARTSLFVPGQSRLYIAVPHRESQRAEIRVYDVH